MIQNDKEPGVDSPGIPDYLGKVSTSELMESSSDPLLDDMDLESPSPKTRLITRARVIEASAISRNTEIKRLFPNSDSLFSQTLEATINQQEGETLKAEQLVLAYRVAVQMVANSTLKQFRISMNDPLALDRFLNHFDVPVHPDIVSELETENPALAQEYKERAHRWTQGA